VRLQEGFPCRHPDEERAEEGEGSETGEGRGEDVHCGVVKVPAKVETEGREGRVKVEESS